VDTVFQGCWRGVRGGALGSLGRVTNAARRAHAAGHLFPAKS